MSRFYVTMVEAAIKIALLSYVFFFLVPFNANIRHVSAGFTSDGRVSGLPMNAANVKVCKSSETLMK